MPEEQQEFQRQVNELLDVVMFENWLRFYFIREAPEDKDDRLILELPEKALEKIKSLYPDLYPVAGKLNGQWLDFEASRNAVLRHIAEEVEGKMMPKGTAQKILQSATFQTRLQMFHTWEQMHEDQLDRQFMEFGAWRKLFSQWLETDGAKELTKKIMEAG